MSWSLALECYKPHELCDRAMNLAAEKTKVIGMCHEFHAFGAYIGPILDLNRPQGMDVLTYLYKWLPEQGLDYTVAGINHFVWLTKAVLNGENVIPRIRKFCEKNLDFDTDDPVLKTIGLAKMALCKQFGYMPLAGDRHLVEFYPSLCNIRNGFGMKFNVVKLRWMYEGMQRRTALDTLRILQMVLHRSIGPELVKK